MASSSQSAPCLFVYTTLECPCLYSQAFALKIFYQFWRQPLFLNFFFFLSSWCCISFQLLSWRRQVIKVFQVIHNPSSVLTAEIQTDTSQGTKAAVTIRLFQQRLGKKKKSPCTLLLRCLVPCFRESTATGKADLLFKFFTVSQGEIRLDLCFYSVFPTVHTVAKYQCEVGHMEGSELKLLGMRQKGRHHIG